MRRYRFLFLLILSQCARQSQPSGGPKDTTPPELISSIPINGQKNYKGKNIELAFDEFVKLKNAEDEIIITPSVATKTKFIAKKNRVIITPQNAWKDSTTYSIAFRDGVQDINESNPADDLHLAFSTSSTIDSLKIFGFVTEMFKDKIPEKITVALYQSDTFEIFKHKPIYFTKTNKKGKFVIQNLKAGNYFIYAFDDKNKNSKVDSKSERFSFQTKPINLESQKDSVHLQLIRVDTRPIKVTSVRNSNTISTIRFNKLLDSISLRVKGIIYTSGSDRSEFIIYKDFAPTDSLKINIHATDSVQQKLDTAVFVKFTENKKIEEKFKISDWTTKFDINTKTFQAEANSNKLISSVNYDSIYIQIDTINYQPIKKENIVFDTLTKTIKLKVKLNIEITESTLNPVLLFGKGAFVTIDNDSTKAKDLKINIPKIKEMGILSVEIDTQEKNFEIQLINNTGTLIESFRNFKKYTFNYLPPGEYKIIVIVDTNNNHRWDAGNFDKKTEPERALIYKNIENKTSIPIRANWEVGPLVITF